MEDAVQVYFITNPVWGGLRLLYRLIGAKQTETGYGVVQRDIVSAAHLQNALHQLHHIETPDKPLLRHGWKDLETAIETIGQQMVFVTSELPTTLRDCSTRVRLALGARAWDFARNSRRKAAPFKGKPRGFEMDLPLFQALMHNYENRDASGDSRIKIFSSNIMSAMVTGSRKMNLHFFTGTDQEVQHQLQDLGFEIYLSTFRNTMLFELSACMLDYASIAKDCRDILHTSSHELSHMLDREGTAYVEPLGSHWFPASLLVEEETLFHARNADTNPNVVLSKWFEHAAKELTQMGATKDSL